MYLKKYILLKFPICIKAHAETCVTLKLGVCEFGGYMYSAPLFVFEN